MKFTDIEAKNLLIQVFGTQYKSLKDLQDISQFMYSRSMKFGGRKTEKVLKYIAKIFPSIEFFVVALYGTVFNIGFTYLILILIWMVHFFNTNSIFCDLLLRHHLVHNLNNGNIILEFGLIFFK